MKSYPKELKDSIIARMLPPNDVSVHRHSALKFVTPGQRHRGEDVTILEQRHLPYQQARACKPERWSTKTRDWTPVETVFLNHGKPVKKEEELKQNAA